MDIRPLDTRPSVACRLPQFTLLPQLRSLTHFALHSGVRSQRPTWDGGEVICAYWIIRVTGNLKPSPYTSRFSQRFLLHSFSPFGVLISLLSSAFYHLFRTLFRDISLLKTFRLLSLLVSFSLSLSPFDNFAISKMLITFFLRQLVAYFILLFCLFHHCPFKLSHSLPSL